MENIVENENILDVRGEICPYPMLKTNKELDAVIEAAKKQNKI